MPYTIYKSDGTAVIVPDSTIDTQYYSPNFNGSGKGIGTRLVGRNSIGYGAPIAQNFLQLTENFANTTPPPAAIALQGQTWFNSTTGELNVNTSNVSGVTNWKSLAVSGEAIPRAATGSDIGGVIVGTGLSVNGSGVLSLATSGVSAGSYTNSNVTVDAYGRITSISNGSSGGGGVTSFSAGTTGLTPNTATTGAVTLSGVLSVANGGTGANSGQVAINNILPPQTGNANKFLMTNGISAVWDYPEDVDSFEIEMAFPIGGSQISVAHGLGGRPRYTSFSLKCINPQSDYNVGDEVPFGYSWNGGAYNLTPWVNDTTIGVAFNNTGNTIGLNPKAGGAIFYINYSWWSIVMRASGRSILTNNSINGSVNVNIPQVTIIMGLPNSGIGVRFNSNGSMSWDIGTGSGWQPIAQTWFNPVGATDGSPYQIRFTPNGGPTGAWQALSSSQAITIPGSPGEWTGAAEISAIAAPSTILGTCYIYLQLSSYSGGEGA